MKSANAAGVRPRLGALSLEISEMLRGKAAARRRAGTPLVLAASALAASFVAPASAQEPAAVPASIEEITVTGSRIVRRDFESNSPIVTVDS